MKKKYSDPLMFSSVLLMTIDVGASGEGEWGEDGPWPPTGGNRSVFSVNSATAVPASEDPVTIVNPVEEAVTSATTSAEAGVTTDSAGEAVSTSPLEVESIIDEIVPDVTEESGTAASTY